MRETKLCQHLILLSIRDRKAFGKYLLSPYFEVPQRSQKLYGVLEARFFGSNARTLSEEAAAAELFPGEAYDRNRFRKECSYLLRHLEQFLAQLAFSSDPTQVRLRLLAQLNELGDDRYFSVNADALEDEIRANLPATNAFAQLNQLNRERMKRVGRSNARASGLDFAQLIAELDAEYCANRMALLYAELNEYIVNGKQRGDRADSAFLDLVQARLPELPILTRLHYHLYRCTLDHKADTDYQEFRRIFAAAQLPDREAEDMYSAALNHCVRRINAGEARFQRELFSLYNEIQVKGLFDTLPGMLAPHFKNAAVMGCRLGEYAWVGEFIGQNAARIQGMGQGIAVDFAEGVLAYFQGELRTAARHFNKTLVEFRDVYYGLDARGYLMRIHFETEDQLALDSLADSFKMYLRRTKAIPNFRKANYQAFIRMVLRLSRIPAHDRDSLLKLRGELQGGGKVPVADWLLQQVERKLAPQT